MASDHEDAGAQVSGILAAITDLAQTSPFNDLKSPALVVQEFLRGGKVIELWGRRYDAYTMRTLGSHLDRRLS